ncbi:MAG: glutathione S-transferase N-terminal domain-containing protein [bacterium]
MSSADYKLYGMLMSPYSMKMRAYLRYRRIPFQWCNDMRAQKVAETKVKTYMVPVIEYPDGTFENDSTPIIDKLESRIPQRRTEPENEADAFLAYLIEDFADEWLLWPFFMHRWRSEADKKHNSQWILYEVMKGNTDNEQFAATSEFWAERQTELVQRICGSPDNHDLLDASLQSLLRIMEKSVSRGLFFFGTRPSRAEFAIFGVLSQEIQDLTPSKFMRDDYNFTMRWVSIIDDLSGCEGEWEALSMDAEKLMASPVAELLKLSGSYHLPLLQANADALAKGEKMFSFPVDGSRFEREAHKRHLPCLPALQRRYAELSNASKEALRPVLEQTDCLDYLTAEE